MKEFAGYLNITSWKFRRKFIRLSKGFDLKCFEHDRNVHFSTANGCATKIQLILKNMSKNDEKKFNPHNF